MWRAVFLHEFSGGNVHNFHALPGTLTVSDGMRPPHAGPRRSTVLTMPAGEGLRFRLAEPWAEVIGVSGRIRLTAPRQNRGAPFSVMQVGPNVHLCVQFASADRVFLKVGSAEVELATVRIDSHELTDLRFDWHTSGQARLLLNGRLVGYHNALAPGSEVSLDEVTIGHALPDPDPLHGDPEFQVSRVFVRALRRVDALLLLSQLVGDVTPPVGVNAPDCLQQRVDSLLTLTDRIRSFMAASHLQLSQPWQESQGASPGPFSPEAIRAHRAAIEAGSQLVRILASRDFSAPEAFLVPFGELLEILHAAQPSEFRQLLADHLAAEPSADICDEMGDALLTEHGEVLQPIFDLFTRADERLKSIAGVV